MANRMPYSTSTSTTTAAVNTARTNSPGLSRRMSRKPRKSIGRTAMKNTMAPSTQRGRYCRGFGQKEQNERNGYCGSHLGKLALAPGAFDHRGLSWASVHHKRPTQRCRGVGRRQTDQVDTFVQLLMVAPGIETRSRRALRKDHHK